MCRVHISIFGCSCPSSSSSFCLASSSVSSESKSKEFAYAFASLYTRNSRTTRTEWKCVCVFVWVGKICVKNSYNNTARIVHPLPSKKNTIFGKVHLYFSSFFYISICSSQFTFIQCSKFDYLAKIYYPTSPDARCMYTYICWLSLLDRMCACVCVLYEYVIALYESLIQQRYNLPLALKALHT